jgi:hypothetical protein
LIPEYVLKDKKIIFADEIGEPLENSQQIEKEKLLPVT